MKLQDMTVDRCLTAAGFLVHENKILLIKHTMLGIWLAPGGHVEPNELPHQAAEREFFEETGVKVRAITAFPTLPSLESENLPLPFGYNLHWINKPGEKKARSNGKICGQHYVFTYFVEPVGALKLSDADDGIDAIQWFTREEVKKIETREGLRQEMIYVLDHYPKRA